MDLADQLVVDITYQEVDREECMILMVRTKVQKIEEIPETIRDLPEVEVAVAVEVKQERMEELVIHLIDNTIRNLEELRLLK